MAQSALTAIQQGSLGYAIVCGTEARSYNEPEMSNPNTLLEVIETAPAERTAILLPKRESASPTNNSGIRSLRWPTPGVHGNSKGDRVATYLPNGLPTVVSFLAASIAGTAAPLNPGYREDEVSFYLEDTAAKVLLCPPDGAEAARKAAETKGVPVYSLEMDATGFVRIAGAPSGKTASPPSPDDVALVLHTSGSTGRPKRVPIMHGTWRPPRGTSSDTIALRPTTSRFA